MQTLKDSEAPTPIKSQWRVTNNAHWLTRWLTMASLFISLAQPMKRRQPSNHKHGLQARRTQNLVSPLIQNLRLRTNNGLQQVFNYLTWYCNLIRSITCFTLPSVLNIQNKRAFGYQSSLKCNFWIRTSRSNDHRPGSATTGNASPGVQNSNCQGYSSRN